MIVSYGHTYGQTNNGITVDRDSLFNVFSNFDRTKAERNALKRDTATYKAVIVEYKAKEASLKDVIGNYEGIVVPNKDKVIESLNLIIGQTEKKAKKKYFKGARDGSVLGIILGILVSIL